MRFAIVARYSLALAAASLAAAQTADEVLDKYVQAIGGQAAVEKVTSRVAKGKIEFPQDEGRGTIEVSAKAPDKYYNTYTIPDWGTFRRAVEGASGWAEDPDNGVQDLSGSDLAMTRRDADLRFPIRLKELFPNRTVKGKEEINGRPVLVVELTGAENPEKMYFDAESGLLVRRTVQVQRPDARISMIVEYDDYRDVEGVRIPFYTRNASPETEMVVQLEKVTHNVPVDDATFKKPAK